MYGGGSQGDRIFADFQARRLAAGQPVEYDRAEAHMVWFRRVVLAWTAITVLLAALALWLVGDLAAAAAVASGTVVAVVVGVRLLRRDRRSELQPPDMS